MLHYATLTSLILLFYLFIFFITSFSFFFFHSLYFFFNILYGTLVFLAVTTSCVCLHTDRIVRTLQAVQFFLLTTSRPLFGRRCQVVLEYDQFRKNVIKYEKNAFKEVLAKSSPFCSFFSRSQSSFRTQHSPLSEEEVVRHVTEVQRCCERGSSKMTEQGI